MYRIAVCLAVVCPAVWAQSSDTDSFQWQERWDHYLERTYSWKRVAVAGAESAFEPLFQLNKCGRPPYCVPHHFGGALVRRTARTTMELGAGALLREDLRRTPSGLTGFRRRAMFAMTHAVLAKGPDGDWRPAYSRYAGTLAAVAVSSAWDGRPLTAERLSRSFGFTVTSYFQDALFAEFEPDLRRIARHALQSFRGTRSSVHTMKRSMPRFFGKGDAAE